MKKTYLTAILFFAGVAASPATAGYSASSGFWSGLKHNGPLSAGWVEVLPVLASSCDLRLDTHELNSSLVNLSQDDGNASYSIALYSTLNQMEQKKSRNHFVDAWTTMFKGNQQQACAAAEALWGAAGKQFPGILKREDQPETTGSVAPTQANACQ